MKKVLFATTALIATAGVASADIGISGDGRMGFVNTEATGNADNETQFNSRIRITFTASGTTDAGLEFGGSVRADNAGATNAQATGTDAQKAGTNGGVNGQGGSVYISGDFGKVTMGDVGSAHESATGDLAGVGYTMSSNEMGYAGGSHDEGVAWSYSVDNLTLYASMGQPQSSSANNQSGVGLSYSMAGVTLGVGTADDGTTEETSASIRASVAGIGITAIILDRDNDTTYSGETGLSLSYAVDSNLSVAAFTRSREKVGAADLDYTGVGFSMNLGGGATLAGGYTQGGGDGASLDSMDLGLKFAF
ncbi:MULTISPECIES: porin [unclassified Roseobacter]|uniref:porin n=1 Tax=unclassified Roseobacter TaxID=196798 RepID=UPI0030EDCE7C